MAVPTYDWFVTTVFPEHDWFGEPRTAGNMPVWIAWPVFLFGTVASVPFVINTYGGGDPADSLRILAGYALFIGCNRLGVVYTEGRGLDVVRAVPNTAIAFFALSALSRSGLEPSATTALDVGLYGGAFAFLFLRGVLFATGRYRDDPRWNRVLSTVALTVLGSAAIRVLSRVVELYLL